MALSDKNMLSIDNMALSDNMLSVDNHFFENFTHSVACSTVFAKQIIIRKHL
jgi:hypothetical protein